MNFPELFYMAEAEGKLPTRTGRLNAVIKDINKIPTQEIDSDILLSILNKNGIELESLTEKELNYILDRI